jgi:hypothetical protein
MRITTQLKTLLFLGFTIFAFNACDTETPDYTPPDSSFGLIYTNIFQTSCGLSGCHDGSASYPTLNGENTFQNIVNGDVQNLQADNAGLKLIIPNDSDNSFLYQKINFNNSSHQYGSPMPPGGLVVTSDAIEFVRLWIEAGAPLEGHVADRSLIE